MKGGNVTRCTFTGCCATAIYIHDSFVNVVDCIFRNCHSGDEGGAINIVERDDNVIDCIFINCSAAYKGGAIYVEDFDNNIINCSFINCSSENGGSVYWNGKNGTLNNSKFENSLASQNGGSVYWGGAKGNIENSTFINSRAKNGGAVYIEGKNNVSIYKSKFEKNYADALGGAVYGGNISDCDFSENSLPDVFDSSQNRSETIMEISINPNDAKVGNQISIIPNVMDNNRKTINGTVDLYLESTFIARVNSGEKYVYTANQTGFFEVTAEFTGNENYLESQSSEYFWVDESSSESTGDYDISDIVPDELITMDDGVVILEFPEDATGTVEVFINGNLEIVVEVVDGIARIDLSKYKDNFEFTFKYSGDDVYAGFTKELEVTVNVMVSIILADNLNMLYSSNGKYSIKAYDGDDNLVDGVEITFLINNKIYKTATTKNGVASIVISKAPGSYKITSQFLSVKVTKALKVKHILTLKKVAVKKSAKKLVLQATLSKVNKKYLKGKKITFKFNGKKYTAKTNKKGVAKLTIKSSVLKKLKVGKKITYQATYLKDTVKNKVKVKK